MLFVQKNDFANLKILPVLRHDSTEKLMLHKDTDLTSVNDNSQLTPFIYLTRT